MTSTRAADVGECLSAGWAIYKREAGMLSVATLVMLVLNAVAGWIPFANLLVYAPLLAGLYLMIMRAERGEEVTVGALFEGFQQFVPLVIASILTSILITLGLILLVLPGIFLAMAYSLTILIIADRKLDFWPAMEMSRRSITAHFGSYLLLSIVVMVILVISAIPFGLGLLIALPFCMAAQYHFYRSILGAIDDDVAPVEL